jgi:nucleotide-binding universal stress UspA family protein
MFEKILVPLDGSKIAEQAFPFVAELATAFGSEVICAGICEPEESEYGHVCQVYINSQAELLKNKMGTTAKMKPVVLSGRAADEILNYAKNNNVSLVVMTSHGRSGIKPWSLGSTVDKVLHKVDAPLLIIKATEKAAASGKTGLFSKILAPLDGSKAGESALPYAIELMKKLNAEVVLFEVLATGKHVHTIGGLNYVNFQDLDMNSTKVTAEEYLSKLSGKFEESKASAKFDIRMGDPAEEIIKYAREKKASLITLSSHGHSGIERWAYGSVTYKVLQTTDKSVLLVPFARS